MATRADGEIGRARAESRREQFQQFRRHHGDVRFFGLSEAIRFVGMAHGGRGGERPVESEEHQAPSSAAGVTPRGGTAWP